MAKEWPGQNALGVTYAQDVTIVTGCVDADASPTPNNQDASTTRTHAGFVALPTAIMNPIT